VEIQTVQGGWSLRGRSRGSYDLGFRKPEPLVERGKQYSVVAMRDLYQCTEMLERDATKRLTGRIEIDDAYMDGERSGSKRGRGARAKTPFVG
jgi:hypothetical protein